MLRKQKQIMEQYQQGFVEGLKWAVSFAIRPDLFDDVKDMAQLLMDKIDEVEQDINTNK